MQWITDSFQDSVEEMLPRTIEELEELQSVDNTLPGMSSALPVLQESIDPERPKVNSLKDRIMTLMQRDEEKAANAFGMWMVQEDTLDGYEDAQQRDIEFDSLKGFDKAAITW